MKKITNPRLVKRNRTIGSVINLVGMGLAVASAVLNFTNLASENFAQLYGMLLAAFVLFLIGNYLTNRYGRTPPPDDAVDNLLKGLDDSFTSIHFRLGHDHALFTPSGIVAVLPKYEHGEVVFDGKKSWRQNGVSPLRKFFTSEVVGDPIADGRFASDSLAQSLKKILRMETAPEVRPVVVFVNEGTKVDAGESPVPVLPAAKFKEYIRKLDKKAGITPDQMREVLEFCGEKP
jgi:hypothetical protein